MRQKTPHMVWSRAPPPALDENGNFKRRKPLDCVSGELRQEHQRIVSLLGTFVDRELNNKVALSHNDKEIRVKDNISQPGRLLGALREKIELGPILMRELTTDDTARHIIAELSKIEAKILEAQGKGFKIIRVTHGNFDRLWAYTPA